MSQDRTTYQAFAIWRAQFGLSADECRQMYAVLLEQVYWGLVSHGRVQLLHIGTITVDEDPSKGVRFRAAKFLRNIRRRLIVGDPDDDDEWIQGVLRPLRRHASKGRRRRKERA